MAHRRPIERWAFLLAMGEVERLSFLAMIPTMLGNGGHERGGDDERALSTRGHDLGPGSGNELHLVCSLRLMAPESLPMYKAWEPVLPGFEWPRVSSVVMGQVACRKMGQSASVKIRQLADVFQGLF